MSNDYSGAVPFFASIATLTSFESLVVLANRFRARKDAHRLVLADSLYFSWLGWIKQSILFSFSLLLRRIWDCSRTKSPRTFCKSVKLHASDGLTWCGSIFSRSCWGHAGWQCKLLGIATWACPFRGLRLFNTVGSELLVYSSLFNISKALWGMTFLVYIFVLLRKGRFHLNALLPVFRLFRVTILEVDAKDAAWGTQRKKCLRLSLISISILLDNLRWNAYSI